MHAAIIDKRVSGIFFEALLQSINVKISLGPKSPEKRGRYNNKQTNPWPEPDPPDVPTAVKKYAG